jgi:hypothetical protein
MLRAAMERLSADASSSWHFVEHGAAEVVFHEQAPPAGDGITSIAIIHHGTPVPTDGRPFVSYPPRPEALAAVLSTLDARPSQRSTAAAATFEQSLDALLAAFAVGRGMATLWIGPKLGYAFDLATRTVARLTDDDAELAEELRMHAARCLLTIAPQAPAKAGDLVAEDVLWSLGMLRSPDALVANLAPDERLRMRSWPYAITGSNRVVGAVATRLRRGSASWSDLAREMPGAGADIARALNAMLAAGFVVAEKQAVPRPTQQQPVRDASRDTASSVAPVGSALLGRLRRVLGLRG